MELNQYNIDTEKYKFDELPAELIDYFTFLIAPLLTPIAIDFFTKGNMTIMDWNEKIKFLIKLIK
jgi:hypothetical protein